MFHDVVILLRRRISEYAYNQSCSTLDHPNYPTLWPGHLPRATPAQEGGLVAKEVVGPQEGLPQQKSSGRQADFVVGHLEQSLEDALALVAQA